MLTSAIANGVTFAGLLFLVASGFTLVYGLGRVLNLAHGSLYLWGGYLGAWVLAATGSFTLGLLVAGGAIALAALVMERGLLRHVQGDTPSEVLLSLGLLIMLGDLGLVVWGGTPVSVPAPSWATGPLVLGGLRVPMFRAFVLGVAVVLAIALGVLLRSTRLGARIRACVDDQEMLAALGVNARGLHLFIWVLGGLFAGASGLLGGVMMGLYPGADMEMLLLAIVVVVVGGLGHLWGAAIGSLLIGLSYSFASIYASEYLYFALYGPLIAVLLLRPQGLFGGRTT